MDKKVSLGRPGINETVWIQDIKINPFKLTIDVLVPTKNGMEWMHLSEHTAREIGFINPEAILKIINPT